MNFPHLGTVTSHRIFKQNINAQNDVMLIYLIADIPGGHDRPTADAARDRARGATDDGGEQREEQEGDGEEAAAAAEAVGESGDQSAATQERAGPTRRAVAHLQESEGQTRGGK